jgi:hypothetical protein
MARPHSSHLLRKCCSVLLAPNARRCCSIICPTLSNP